MDDSVNELLANGAIGVIGGLIATILTIFINSVWLSIIIPWYEELIYHDARFEGVWDAIETYSDSSQKETLKFTITFERKGHKVKATSICIDGPDKGKIYLMDGSFKNLILVLSYISEDPRSIERGTLAMKLVEDGKKFVGCGAYYSSITEKVHSSVFEATYQGKSHCAKWRA